MRTLEEIEACPKTMLTPADVAGYLGCDQHNICTAVKQAPELIGFPASVIGTRVRIPKEGFVRWAKGLNLSGHRAPRAADQEARRT